MYLIDPHRRVSPHYLSTAHCHHSWPSHINFVQVLQYFIIINNNTSHKLKLPIGWRRRPTTYRVQYGLVGPFNMSMAAVGEHALWEGGGAGSGSWWMIVGILIGTWVTCNFAFSIYIEKYCFLENFGQVWVCLRDIININLFYSISI